MEKNLNYKEIENTPFIVVWNEHQEYKIVMGNDIITNKVFKNLKDAIYFINKKPWELILNASLYFNDKVNELRQQQKQSKKQK